MSNRFGFLLRALSCYAFSSSSTPSAARGWARVVHAAPGWVPAAHNFRGWVPVERAPFLEAPITPMSPLLDQQQTVPVLQHYT
jgi:hypothetical protein